MGLGCGTQRTTWQLGVVLEPFATARVRQAGRAGVSPTLPHPRRQGCEGQMAHSTHHSARSKAAARKDAPWAPMAPSPGRMDAHAAASSWGFIPGSHGQATGTGFRALGFLHCQEGNLDSGAPRSGGAPVASASSCPRALGPWGALPPSTTARGSLHNPTHTHTHTHISGLDCPSLSPLLPVK